MHAEPMIDDMADDLIPILHDLTSKPELLRPDLQRLRYALHRHGPIDRRQAAEFFQANRNMRADHEAWHELYLAALTGFFLEYHEDRFVLPERSAELLLGWLGAEKAIANVGERRLTLRLLLRAADVPERFERRILDAIAYTLTHRSDRWSSAIDRTPGLIDMLDLHLIGCLVRRPGHQPPNRLSHAMISFLLELDSGPCRFVDASAWQQLLVDCLVRYLSHHLRTAYASASAPSRGVTDDLNTLLHQSYGPGMDCRLRQEVLSKVAQHIESID